MSIDRFIKWKEPRSESSGGDPTIERVAQTARDFLGPRWKVEIEDCWIYCTSPDRPTFHLRSEFLLQPDNPHMQTHLAAMEEMFSECRRGFSIFFKAPGEEGSTSVLTGLGTDSFSGALADKFAKLIALWWYGEVEWPC